MMSFLFPFMNFLQPGILWPQLAGFKPMLLLSLLALLVGAASKASYPRGLVFRHPAFFWFTVFVLAQVVSLVPAGVMTAVGALTFFGAYLIFVAASAMLMTDEKSLSRYVWGMLVGCMFIVVFGIDAVIHAKAEAVGGRAGAYGMYENHNDYSFIIIQIVPFLYLYRKASQSFSARLLLGLSLLACIVGILLSLSRGGMMALVLEFVLLVLLGMEGRKRYFLLPVLAVVGALAIAYQWSEREENQAGQYSAADAQNSRIELWLTALRMVQANPLLGVGSGGFGEHAGRYGEISGDNRGKNTHNTYLEVVTGSGLIGLGAFVMMLWRLIQGLRRDLRTKGPPLLDTTMRATLIALYTLLFRATLDAKTNDWSFYVLCAIGVVCMAMRHREDAPAEARSIVNR